MTYTIMSILILNSILFYRKSQEQDFKRMTNAVFFLKTQRFRYILLAKKDQKKNKQDYLLIFYIFHQKWQFMSRSFIVHVYTKNKALINLINLIEQSFCYEKSLKEEYLTFPKPVGTFLDSK